MQTKRFHRALILGAVLLLMAGTTAAMAEPRGGGYGGYGMDNSDCPMLGQGSGHGMGPGMMGPGRNHGGNAPELTKEQQDKLDAAREKFWTENRKLRRDIEYKQDDLYDELTKVENLANVFHDSVQGPGITAGSLSGCFYCLLWCRWGFAD
ncbi:MAG: hypothetical protein HZB24_15170 [Desulfobacterales bacterium]|nr:hypothetical protein [Desulfobacterales bacterium]